MVGAQDDRFEGIDSARALLSKRDFALNVPVHEPTELFRWWILDPRTGKRRLTRTHLSRDLAQRCFPGAQPDRSSREFRHLREGDEMTGDTLPPEPP